jgi:cyclic pyranopterin phosphate synthase
MSVRTIPIRPLVDHPSATARATNNEPGLCAASMPEAVQRPEHGHRDVLGRPLHDLRISVTDRCNFRCGYCMPRSVYGADHAFLPHSQMLRFEEITQVAAVFMGLGVRKIRLTGGEPLLRRDLEVLVAQLGALRTADGHPPDLTLTTNGSALRHKAAALKRAGLRRLTVSLDALSDRVFRQMNDADFPVADVLDGIAAAQDAGFQGIKVNMVVKRGTNDQEVLPMAAFFRGRGIELRFIEYMDVGSHNQWRLDEVWPSDSLRQHIHEQFPLSALPRRTPDETAQRYAYVDGQGAIGLISSVTRAFCGECSRARLSTDGRLYTCLFARQGHDLRSWIRPANQVFDPAALREALIKIWMSRSDRYSELRSEIPRANSAGKKVEMHYIGG